MKEVLSALITEIKTLQESMNEDMDKNLKGNKSAGARARKTSLLLGKKYLEYRKLSVK